jgi:hypothetical protein
MNVTRATMIVCATLLLGAGVALLGGCGGGKPREEAGFSGASASNWVPDENLRDWVGYAVQVSTVTVLSEKQLDPPEGDEFYESGEGPVGRSVVLRIDRTIWAPRGAKPLDGEIEILDWGWWLKDGTLRPFGARMEVGGTYLVPFIDIYGRIGSMAVSAIPVSDGRAETEFPTARRWMSELQGMTIDAIATELAQTTPDPLPAQFAHLPSVERFDAVQAAKAAAYHAAETATASAPTTPEPTPTPAP